MKYIITGAAIAWALYMADKYLFFKKKNPNKLMLGVLNFKINYLCFLVLNFPPLTSCSKKEPSASPTLVKVTPVAPS